jgi:hypothetical protein
MAIFVMQTPLAPLDISSPNKSFPNFSFIVFNFVHMEHKIKMNEENFGNR